MDLAQPLQRWAELEQNRCLFGQESIWLLIDGHWQIIHGTANWADLATIEYALREAIIARGWRIEMTSPRFGGPEWVAGIPVEKDGVVQWYDAKHEQPAIALLIAYLSALEATC